MQSHQIDLVRVLTVIAKDLHGKVRELAIYTGLLNQVSKFVDLFRKPRFIFEKLLNECFEQADQPLLQSK